MEDCRLSKYKESVAMDIEEGFQSVKACGRFQIILQFIATYIALTTGYTGLFSFFIFDNPPWKCLQNATSDFCKENNGTIFSNENKNFTKRCTLERSDWTYVAIENHSAVTEFDLICEKTALAATGGSALWIGGLFGAIITGKLADMYGRKPVLMINLCISIVVSFSCGFVSNVWQLIGLRIILGACFASFYTITMVYLMELVDPKWRTVSGILYNTTYTLSLILTDVYAYYERRWRTLQIYIALPAILALILFCFLPESPRWLLATKKKEKAEKILKMIGRFNGAQMTSSLSLKTPEDTHNNTYSYFSLFKYKKVALTTISMSLMWMTSATTYYALGLESSSLGGDMYHVFAYSAIAEIPSNILAIFCCDNFGRKKSILGGMFLGGIVTGLVSFRLANPKARYIYNLVLAFTARLFITMSYNSSYVWGFEVFPTVVRSQGLCICTIFERLGGMLSPYLVSVLQEVSPKMPFFIILCLALLTALFGFLILPETNKKPTREQFEDFYEKREVDGRPANMREEREMGQVNETIDESSENTAQ